jgi:hypothetical protein
MRRRFQGCPIEEQPMKAIIVLAAAAVTIGACTYRTETVERQTPSGRTVVTESAGVTTPTLVVRE